MKYLLTIFLLCFTSVIVFGTSAYEQDGYVYISHNGEVQKYYAPKGFTKNASYKVKFNPPKTDPFTNPPLPNDPNKNLAENKDYGVYQGMKFETILRRANKLYHKKKFEKAMTLLDAADGQYPENARVKTMKGSLYYLMGWKKFAKQYWSESLKIDPNQKKIRNLLKQLGGTQGQEAR